MNPRSRDSDFDSDSKSGTGDGGIDGGIGGGEISESSIERPLSGICISSVEGWISVGNEAGDCRTFNDVTQQPEQKKVTSKDNPIVC